MAVLKVKNLTKSFISGQFLFKKQKIVLNNLSFSLSKGEVTGFLGANGTGKSSAIKCVLGLIPFELGEVSFFGGQGLSRSVLKKIGYLPEEPSLYPFLTAEELLLFYGRLSSTLSRYDLLNRSKALLQQLDLRVAKNQLIRTFSRGMLRKLGLAQALLCDPELLILDEPLAGLDPDIRLKVRDMLKEQSHKGTTVFFSSHLLEDMQKISDQIITLPHKCHEV